MRDDLMIEAGVSLACRDCGRRTLVPASKVEPGVKCRSCGAELAIDTAANAAKAVMLAAAARRNDVKTD